MNKLLLLTLGMLTYSASVYAGEFRCFAKYQDNRGQEADILLYGEINNNKMSNARFEFVGDNGFYGENNLVVSNFSLIEDKLFNFSATQERDEDGTLKLNTRYNKNRGNYLGTLNFNRTDVKPEKVAVRCVFLRGI